MQGVPSLDEIRKASKDLLERRQSETDQLRLIRLPSVLEVVALSRSEWYRLVALGRAPRPVPLGDRARAWVEAEVLAWAKERIAARDKAAA